MTSKIVKIGIYSLLVILFVNGCKSGDATESQAEHVLTLLISKDLSPADLSELKAYTVDEMKRVSKTENLWMVKIQSNLGVETIKKDLLSSEAIQSVSINEKRDEKPTNSTNTKKSKSSPIKN